MKLYRSILLIIILTTGNHLNLAMSQEHAAKDFVYKNLDVIKKYQTFTRGDIQGNTIFDIVFPLAEKKMSDQDIYNNLLAKSSFFSYENKQKSIQEQQAALIGSISGFIPALKNQLNMFFILMPGILGSQTEEIAKPNEIDETKDWQPELPKILSISEKNIEWAEQELIVELDFYITEFAKAHDLKLKPTAHMFDIWLQGFDSWWKKEEFEKWINLFVNIMTKDRRSLPVIKFTDKSMLFFLSNYIPQMLIIQNPSITKVDWDMIKKQFPGFAIYENKKIFHFAEDITRKHNMAFLVRMINENLTQTIKNNPEIGKIATKKKLNQPKKHSSLFNLLGAD